MAAADPVALSPQLQLSNSKLAATMVLVVHLDSEQEVVQYQDLEVHQEAMQEALAPPAHHQVAVDLHQDQDSILEAPTLDLECPTLVGHPVMLE